MTSDLGGGAPVLALSPRAMDRVLEILGGEEDAEDLALWLEVTGVVGDQYGYDIYFAPLAEARRDDDVTRQGQLSIVVPAASIDLLRGSTLDVSRDLLHPGMMLDNPNRPSEAASPTIARDTPLELSGDTAERITQVLEQHINPAIASHGGRAELAGVEDDVAYLRLGGGCVGCGMASVTLSQGIEVAILEAVPEITRVVDVTDHASGNNPYYEPAKK